MHFLLPGTYNLKGKLLPTSYIIQPRFGGITERSDLSYVVLGAMGLSANLVHLPCHTVLQD